MRIIPKWYRELNCFIKIKSTFLFEGNIYDVLPQFGNLHDSYDSFTELDEFLHIFNTKLGYKVCFYDSINGFYNRFDENVINNIFATINIGGIDIEECPNEMIKKKLIIPLEDAGKLTKKIMVESNVPTVVILNFASRYIQAPDRLNSAERELYTNLLYASLNAKTNFVREKGNFKNLLFLIMDKSNDAPTWFYMNNPYIKSINIPTPDKHVRRGYIDYNIDDFIREETYLTEEIEKYSSTFVNITEGMKNLDLKGLKNLCKQEEIPLRRIGDVVSLYKYGIKENPWNSIEINKLENADAIIKKRVKGQDIAVSRTLDVIKRAVGGLSGLQHSSNSSKPKGILFFAGPTGTGKTEMAKSLAQLLFGDESSCRRFDMSEYQQSHSDQKLLGAPPGYVGYEAGGQLTNIIKEHPFSILLFDEIEKAHPSILDKFLQILEDGRMTDGQGDTVYFSECIIIFTSNLGIYTKDKYGNLNKNTEISMQYSELSKNVINGIKDYFTLDLGRPEILNRIGNNLIVFDYIKPDAAKEIIKSQIEKIVNTIYDLKSIKIKITEEVQIKLEEKAFANLENGGRGIGNVVEENFINPLSRYIFDNKVENGSTLIIQKITGIDQEGSITELVCGVK